MRILHICTEKSWRGGENQIRLLIEGSEPLGVRNFVAVPEGGRSFEKFSALMGDPEHVVPLASKNAWNPVSISRLVRFCRRQKIDILDAQGSGGLGLALWVRQFIPSLKIVAHRRVDLAVARNFLSKKKYLSPRIDRFVAISHRIRSTLRECGIDESRVSVVPSAVDERVYRNIDPAFERSQLLKRFSLPADTVLIGNASALVPTKGNQFLISALPQITASASHPVHLLLAGEGSQKQALEDSVREAGLQARVSFLGHIDAVPNFLAGLDIMAMPSMTEGLGTITLDAILADTAVAASDVGGIPEIVRHEETGLLFPVGDVDKLAASVVRLAEDAALRERLKRQALAHVRQSFSLETMVRGNFKIYQALMA